MSAEVNVPDEAVAIVAGQLLPNPDIDVEREKALMALQDAAPLIAAADYEAFAAELRATLHNLPEYTHGSLAWNVMNAIDQHIEDLRGDK